MDVSVENTGGLGRRMTVQVPSERVDQEVQSRLASMSKTIRLDGFRPGKVPLKVVAKKYGEQVRLEVVEQVVNTTLQEALSRENIRPVGQPSVETKPVQSGGTLEYVVTFEVFPELPGTMDYSFKVTRPIVEIIKDDIDNMLENLRKQRVTWNIVERPAQPGDQVNIDFEGSIDGAPFAGNKAEQMSLELGSNTMIPGFEDQLAGASAGDERTLKITFPHNYQAAEVAGKEAEFKVKVHSVSEPVLPELDDDFARAFGVDASGIDGLRDEVRNNMQRELDGLVASRLKEQVFSGLVKCNPVEVPRVMIDSEIQQLQSQESGKGMDSAALEATAERRVKLGVLVSEIVKQNNIMVDPDRVRGVVDTIAASYEKPEEVVQWYYGNQDMLANVQSSVIEEQVVEWVIANSGVEVTDQETGFSRLVDEAIQSQG
ncbi:MAG: trigger factor [Gammaproteobacteria bacterium]